MTACVGRAAIFPQLLSSRSSLLAVLRRRLGGEGPVSCSSSARDSSGLLLPARCSSAPPGASCCPGLLPESHRQQGQGSIPPQACPAPSGLWLCRLWGAQEQQLNIQVLSLPAPAALPVGCGSVAAARTQRVPRTSRGSRQLLPDPFVNSGANSRPKPAARQTPGNSRLSGHPGQLSGDPSGEPGAWQLHH